MYASPIIYPASAVPDRWRWVVTYNPMSWAVEATRQCLAGRGTFGPEQMLAGTVSALVLLLAGLFAFNRVQRTFVDMIEKAGFSRAGYTNFTGGVAAMHHGWAI